MAFLHRTWTFDPAAVHERIAARVVDGDEVDNRRLLELTRETAREATAATAHYLEMIRYDDSWLDEHEIEESELYVACLGPHLRPAPNIYAPMLFVLFLRDRRGWTNEDAWRVLRGDPLSTLPLADRLMDAIRPHLTLQFGGWMSKDVADDVLGRVRDEGDAIRQPTREDVRWLTERLRSDAGSARETLIEANQSAVTALSALAEQPLGIALRCIAD